MATAKEIKPAYVQPPETLRGEQNSFLRFIDENKDLFERHSSLTYELRDEEQGWRNSSTLGSIVKMSFDLVLLLYPELDTIRGKQMRQLKMQAENHTINFALGASDGNKSIIKYFSDFLSRRPHNTLQSQILSEACEKHLNEFRTSFHEARAPLVSGIRESKAELMRQLENFISSDPSSVFEFEDFLSDKNYVANREEIRPFLASLAETEYVLARDNKEGVLHRKMKNWIDELKERPSPATIDEFVASIKSPTILEWLEFAAQGEDIANFLKSRPDVSVWTTELREELSSCVKSRYFTALSSIEKNLEQYRRRAALKAIIPKINPQLGAEIKTAVIQMPAARPKGNDKKASEKAEKAKHPVGILRQEVGSSFQVRVLTEEELTGRLQKESDSLAPADQRMIADLEKIFLSLREDPYGLGTKKLNDMSIMLGHKELPLRSLDPGKRIGLSHDHPDSHDIRIAYIIDKNNGVPMIGLLGVYRHDDFMSRFKFGK